MKTGIMKAAGVLAIGSALAVSATPATARPWGYGGGHGYHHGGGGGRTALALGAGVLGLAVGASLAAPHYYDRGYGYRTYYAPPPPPPVYYRPAPAPVYYGGYEPAYGGGYAPVYRGYGRQCVTRTRYNAYSGEYVKSKTCY